MNSLALPLGADQARSIGLPTSDTETFVDTVFPLFGGGPVLVIGCGEDALVATLRRRGLAAASVDAAADLTALPFGDGACGTLVVCHVLEYAGPETLAAIARELYRVATRYLFVRVSTRRLGGAPPLSTEWSRQPWENCFLKAGFMRHPLGFNATPYEALEDEGPQILLAFERPPIGLDHRFSLDDLRAERNLHMDMLRESGRRADAHIARYHLAARFVRPGDRVLDAACGLGYGSAVLHDGTLARSVTGLDNSAFAVEYCRSECGAHRPRTSFVRGDITDLERLEAGSVDVVVSFETMEHIDDPEAFVRNVSRLLTPGGRLICSVPNLWVDETGCDPNPYHLHVFDRDRLLAVCGKFLLIEQLFGQTAGNGFKKTDERRRMTPVGLSDRQVDPEWWVLVAVKPVDEHAAVVRPESSDHENPRLLRTLVNTDHRITSPDLLLAQTVAVLDTSGERSADRGAALWVLAQLHLERALPLDARLAWAIGRYCSAATDHPGVRRWQIVIEHALARWHMLSGGVREAERLFARCALRDCLACAPVPAETVDAAFWAGWLCVQRRAWADARNWWTRGLGEARRAAVDSRAPDADRLTRLFDLATRCEHGLEMLSEFGDRPGMAAAHTIRSLGASAEAYARQLTSSTHTARQVGEELRLARAQHEAERQTAARLLAEREARIASLTQSLLRFAIPDPRGFVVFGAGQGGRNAIARLRSLGGHVSCVVDNREAVWDTEVDRVRALSPARLRSQPFAMIVIASSIGYDAIVSQLTGMGFLAGEHFVASEDLSCLARDAARVESSTQTVR